MLSRRHLASAGEHEERGRWEFAQQREGERDRGDHRRLGRRRRASLSSPVLLVLSPGNSSLWGSHCRRPCCGWCRHRGSHLRHRWRKGDPRRCCGLCRRNCSAAARISGRCRSGELALFLVLSFANSICLKLSLKLLCLIKGLSYVTLSLPEDLRLCISNRRWWHGCCWKHHRNCRYSV